MTPIHEKPVRISRLGNKVIPGCGRGDVGRMVVSPQGHSNSKAYPSAQGRSTSKIKLGANQDSPGGLFNAGTKAGEGPAIVKE